MAASVSLTATVGEFAVTVPTFLSLTFHRNAGSRAGHRLAHRQGRAGHVTDTPRSSTTTTFVKGTVPVFVTTYRPGDRITHLNRRSRCVVRIVTVGGLHDLRPVPTAGSSNRRPALATPEPCRRPSRRRARGGRLCALADADAVIRTGRTGLRSVAHRHFRFSPLFADDRGTRAAHLHDDLDQLIRADVRNLNRRIHDGIP